MGSFVKFDEETEQRPTLETGTYGETQDAAITDSKMSPIPSKTNEDVGEWWQFSVGVRTEQGMVFANSSPFGPNNTQNVKFSGSKAKNFAAQLGFDPAAGFDVEDAMGMKVVVDVKERSWEDNDGNKQTRLQIQNVWKK